FNTSNVTSMRGTFERMYSLENIDVSHFDTSKVTDMTAMFMGLRKIKKLDLRNFNTSKVKIMIHMFNDCTSLTDLNVTSFDTSNVNSMSNMFNYTPSLQVIDLSSFKITSSVAQTNYTNFVTTSNTSLTVIATDPYFFSYDYSRDKRTVPQILFNANGGNYVNGKTQLNYFTSCAIRPEETSLDKLEEFKQNNLPIKTGFLFNGYTTTTDTSQATSVLDLIGTVYDAQWKTRTVSLEVPTTISFGTHKLSKGTNYYSVDTVEGTSLSVTDDRGIGSKWQLTAKLQTPFTNNGKTLSNSLVYKTSTGEETITENVAQIIATHTTGTDSEKTVVSDNWTNAQGLMLKLEEGKAYAGEYSGTIEWTLNVTP
ncbi:BspA family leucine-rich repeat surface protein, partial [Enterococcus faecalis]|nr:BspA family leucine-rich repeat surface protein [Enterococcus faecalis]